MLSYSALLLVSMAAVMLMDNGVGAQNNYYYRNSLPSNRFRQMQSNPFASSRSNTFKPNNINPVVAKNNNNNWGWPTAVQQQNRWNVNFDNSIEDNSVESSESWRRPSAARTQRHSITGNSNPHSSAWSRQPSVPVQRPQPIRQQSIQQQPIRQQAIRQQPMRWNTNFHDSDEDHSFESRENRRW